MFHPSVRLGLPTKEELNECKEINLENDTKLFLHNTLLELCEEDNPVVDVQWTLFGRKLTIKNCKAVKIGN